MSATVFAIEPLLVDGQQGVVMIKVRDGAFIAQTAISLVDAECISKAQNFVSFVEYLAEQYRTLTSVLMPGPGVWAAAKRPLVIVREDPTGYSGASEPQVYSEDALIDPDTF